MPFRHVHAHLYVICGLEYANTAYQACINIIPHDSPPSTPGSIPNNPDGRSIFGDETITCQDAYDLGPILLPEDNCTFFQDIGTKVCYCGVEIQTNYSCTLCEDGTALPQGLLEAFPGETCAEMQVDAKRDTNESMCVYYQGVVGHYCGCNNPVTSADTCRICGDGIDLPNPQQKLRAATRSTSSCLQVEFNASVRGTCDAARDTYQMECCSGTPSPTPTSSAIGMGFLSLVGTTSVMVCGIWAIS